MPSTTNVSSTKKTETPQPITVHDVSVGGDSRLTVNNFPPLNPLDVSSPDWGTWDFDPGYKNKSYDHQWDMVNVNTPVTYSVVSGSLPTGLTLTSLGGGRGEVSGTPTAVGSFSFTLRATNAYGTDDKAFSIDITVAGGTRSAVFIS